jgi:hypothetical protein
MTLLKISSVVLLFAALVGSASAVCTNTNVVGVWGFQLGTAVGQFTADGNGNITSGSATVNSNGTVTTGTFTGTYSVAKNCTGSATFNITGDGTWLVNFVLDAGKKGAEIILIQSGTTAQGRGLARGVVTCGLTGKKQTLAANLLGKIPNTGPISYVAQVILSGTGKVSGSGTFDVNGVIVTAPITGTYTENADCTGTLQITPTGLSTLNFAFVAAAAGKEILLIETDNAAVAGYMLQ